MMNILWKNEFIQINAEIQLEYELVKLKLEKRVNHFN